jgi:hypothetical protein
LSFADAALTFFCFPELYAPVLLARKAKRLRSSTANSHYHHPHESIKIDVYSILTKHFARPLLMVLTEPIVTVMATYASFVFAVLYMTLQIFPVVYHERRGWGSITSTLPFIAMLVGVITSLGINLSNQPRYARAVERAGNRPVPEARLLPMAAGAILFVAGLFTFAWTAPPHVPWPPSVIAAGLIGAGFTSVFQNCLNVCALNFLLEYLSYSLFCPDIADLANPCSISSTSTASTPRLPSRPTRYCAASSQPASRSPCGL